MAQNKRDTYHKASEGDEYLTIALRIFNLINNEHKNMQGVHILFYLLFYFIGVLYKWTRFSLDFSYHYIFALGPRTNSPSF